MELRDEAGRIVRDIPEDIVTLNLFPDPRNPQRSRYGNLPEVLRHLPHLKTLLFDPDSTTQGLEAVRGFSQLTALEISQVYEDHDLTPIATCTGLKKLSLGVYKADVSPLAALHGLEELALSGVPKGLNALGKLQEILHLQLNHCERLSLKPFTKLTHLQNLYLVSSKLSSFEPIKTFRELRLLDLRGSNLARVSELPACQELRELRLDGCQRLKDLEGLERFPKLRSLWLNELQGLASLHPILGLPELKTLRIVGTRIEDGDISPLRIHPTLAEIVLSEQGKDLAQQCIDRKVTIVGGPNAMVITHVGGTQILKDSTSQPIKYRIDQDLVEAVGGVTNNHQIEDRVRRAVTQQAPDLIETLEFDSEGERLVITSVSLEALQIVARLIEELKHRSASKIQR